MAVSTDNIGSASYGPAVQVDAYTARAPIDVRGYQSLSITLLATVQTLKWTVYGANLSDYSDEVVVQAEAVVAADAVGSYTTTQAPFGFYRAKVANNAGGVVGTAQVQAYAKP